MTISFNLNIPDIDQEQLKKLGANIQAAFEAQVKDRVRGVKFEFSTYTEHVTSAGDMLREMGREQRAMVERSKELTARDEHKHAESCGQLSLESVQAIIDNQEQEEVDARKEAHAQHKEQEQMDASKFAYFTINEDNSVTVYPNETCMSISCLGGSVALRRGATRKVLSESDSFVNEKSNEPIKVNMARGGNRIVITSVLEDGSMRDVVLEFRNAAHECRTIIVSDTIRDAKIGNWMTSIPNWQKHLDEVRENIKNVRASIATTQEVTMSKTNINTLPILKEDATDAGWRIAGRQFTKLTRDPIVAAIARGLGDDSEAMRAKVAAFLKTELGTAIYQGMLSTGLSFMPQATGDIPQRMARELRTEAMAIAGDQVADLLMEPLRQVASMYLAAMPQEVPALEQDTTSVKAEVTIPVSVEAKR